MPSSRATTTTPELSKIWPSSSTTFSFWAALDAAVFDAFNRCELDKLGAYFSEDVEFYHDHDGLSRGRQAFLGAVKDNI